MSQSSKWHFTWFSDTLPELTDACPITYDDVTMRYLICQLERCKTSGRVHLQGYVSLSRSQRIASVQKILNIPGAHLECAKAGDAGGQKYCSKEDTRLSGPWEYGTPNLKGRGARIDLDALKATLKRGASELEVADEHFAEYLRYRPSILAYRALAATPRPCDQDTPIRLVLGSTGLGKTRFVYSECEDQGIYVKPQTSKFWDGYNGSGPVLFDDFRGNYPFTELLRLANSGPYQVECKGGSVQFNPSSFWITSNLRPDDWYRAAINPAPLLRRISVIFMFTAFKECHKYECDPEFPESGQSAWEKFLLGGHSHLIPRSAESTFNTLVQ